MSTPAPSLHRSVTRQTPLPRERRQVMRLPTEALQKVRRELTAQTTSPSPSPRPTAPLKVEPTSPRLEWPSLQQGHLQDLARELGLGQGMCMVPGDQDTRSDRLAVCHAAWLLYLLGCDPSCACLVRQAPGTPLQLRTGPSHFTPNVRHLRGEPPVLLLGLGRPEVVSDALAASLRSMDTRAWQHRLQGRLPPHEIEAIVQRIEHTQRQLQLGNGLTVMTPDDAGWATVDLPDIPIEPVTKRAPRQGQPISTFDIQPVKSHRRPAQLPHGHEILVPEPDGITAGRLAQALTAPDFPWPDDWSDARRAELIGSEADFRSHAAPPGEPARILEDEPDSLSARAQVVIDTAIQLKRRLDKLANSWTDTAQSQDIDQPASGSGPTPGSIVQGVRQDLTQLVHRIERWAQALTTAAAESPAVLRGVGPSDLVALARSDEPDTAFAVEALRAGWNVKDLLAAHHQGVSVAGLWATRAWLDQHPGQTHPALPALAQRLMQRADKAIATVLQGTQAPSPTAPASTSMSGMVAWSLATLPGQPEVQRLADAYEALTTLRLPGLPAARQQLEELRAALDAGLSRVDPTDVQLLDDARSLQATLASQARQLDQAEAMLNDPVWQRPAYPTPGQLGLADWMTLTSVPELSPSMVAAGLLAGWSAGSLADACRLDCPAWTLPLAAEKSRQTGASALAIARQMREEQDL